MLFTFCHIVVIIQLGGDKEVKLSDFVKKYRKMNLLRQIDLADKLEMSKVQVGRIESGKTISNMNHA